MLLFLRIAARENVRQNFEHFLVIISSYLLACSDYAFGKY